MANPEEQIPNNEQEPTPPAHNDGAASDGSIKGTREETTAEIQELLQPIVLDFENGPLANEPENVKDNLRAAVAFMEEPAPIIRSLQRIWSMSVR